MKWFENRVWLGFRLSVEQGSPVFTVETRSKPVFFDVNRVHRPVSVSVRLLNRFNNARPNDIRLLLFPFDSAAAG